jgi:hypothetical protein
VKALETTAQETPVLVELLLGVVVTELLPLELLEPPEVLELLLDELLVEEEPLVVVVLAMEATL